ncbi:MULTISPECIES: Mrp/NBP35 family ATP-binding protein [Microbacterium]|uniref:Mrp/NBP35 family ATP-binding protein n=1 Tax=Microbacterium TaxID=33882 RepID=UPI00277DFDE9|nr:MULTISPECIES: Mrp/NBP35 family ATP-binding protein [Microbacterium]MDQ1076579.1 ATP-binding protein involved in chromosome partitioning [Microbacterium sp. SORGH_AS_0969]MDQ1116817.1 ATP-binding protein involved in chromosome partitioning [Microbacterium testaceum]
MTVELAERVRAAVAAVTDPELRRPLGELDMVREIDVHGSTADVEIALTIVGCPAADRIERDVRDAAASVAGIDAVDVRVGVMSPDERRALTEKLRGGRAKREMPFGPDSLTRVIAVTSGKGGVGKSTLTANLAVALAARGLRVGLIDADVHGFSIPGLLGLIDADGLPPAPTRIDELILPPVAYGVKVISIGMFLRRPGEDAAGAVAWRGPMLHRTVQQFLTDVFFGDLDVLLLDMPPGTGDVAISVGQLLPHADVLVVTTPQAAAADVAVRSGTVARQTGQRVIGVIENMAAMTLPDGSSLDLFGSGGGEAVARALSTADSDVPLLASVPLSPALRGGGDDGHPVVLGAPDDPASRAIDAAAAALAVNPRGLVGRALRVTPSA